MDCKQTHDALSAYVDAELDATAAMQLARHVDDCPACRKALEQMQALRAQVAQQATRYAAPEHLKRRIRAALAAEQATQAARGAARRPPRWNWAWINLGLAALSTTAFAVTLAIHLGQPSSSELMEQELMSSHFRALMPDHLADVASTDQHTVKPWFAGKLDYSPPVYDLAAQGYPLTGGRLDYLHGRTVAALAYRHKLHVIDLYVWPAQAGDSAPQASSRQGFQLLRWRQGGMQFEAVSDINATDLASFASQLRAMRAASQ
jgi:mycothiol system anti-sigma-R factor